MHETEMCARLTGGCGYLKEEASGYFDPSTHQTAGAVSTRRGRRVQRSSASRSPAPARGAMVLLESVKKRISKVSHCLGSRLGIWIWIGRWPVATSARRTRIWLKVGIGVEQPLPFLVGRIFIVHS